MKLLQCDRCGKQTADNGESDIQDTAFLYYDDQGDSLELVDGLDMCFDCREGVRQVIIDYIGAASAAKAT